MRASVSVDNAVESTCLIPLAATVSTRGYSRPAPKTEVGFKGCRDIVGDPKSPPKRLFVLFEASRWRHTVRYSACHITGISSRSARLPCLLKT